MTTSPPIAAIDICNLALDYISETSISSIDVPGDAKEEILARWYDHVRMTVLREFMWNFAQKCAEIPRSGDGSAHHVDAYAMPNELVRLNTVGLDPYHAVTDFDIFGREIHASEGNSLTIWYNRNVTEVGKMDALFVNILALRLAVKLAYKFTKKPNVVKYVSEMLAIEERKAISVDGQERPPKRVQHSKYLAARRSGGSLGRDNRYYQYE